MNIALSFSKKQRIPSWCDRILCKVSKESFDGLSLNAQQLFYTDIPSYTESDHKPLISEYSIKVHFKMYLQLASIVIQY